MPHPTYNGTAIPFFTIPPNWEAFPKVRMLFRTIVKEDLDNGEERQGKQPRCLYGISYATLTLDAQEQAYIRRVIELAQAMPVGIPMWTEPTKLLAEAAMGATVLAVDTIEPTLFSVLRDYVILFQDYKTWEVLKIDSISAGEIVLDDPTGRAWPADTLCYPVLLGKLPRLGTKNLTDENGVHQVDFEERFNGLTDQSLIETAIEPLEFTFTSVCRDEMTCSFSIPEGEMYRLQIAESADGPWFDHIFTSLDGSEATPGRKVLTLNNDYLGDFWFRIVDEEDEVKRSPTNPQASVVAPPILNAISGGGLSVSGNALRGSGGFAFPYSQVENDMISPDEVYLVPRNRYEFDSPNLWDGTPNLLDITEEPGSVTKWTRDGSDPVIDTVLRRLDGFNENAAVYRDDFAFILRLRSFKDGCRSPATTILVDQRRTMRPWYNNSGVAAFTGGFCDLPRDGAEAGWSCNLLFGGVGPFDDLRKVQTIAAADGSLGGALLYVLSATLFTSTYLGWPIHGASWSYYEHVDSIVTRDAALWDHIKPSWTFIYAKVSTEALEEYFPPDDFGATLGTPSGDATSFATALSTYINLNIPHAPTESGQVNLETFDVLLTLHHDFVAYTSPTYVPPVTAPPVAPVADTILGDDFENYLDGEIPGVMNEGTGWSGAWTITTYLSAIGSDDFETYDEGETDDQTLSEGENWSGAWTIRDYSGVSSGGDDFESYADGVIENTFLEGGEGWDGAWSIGDYSGYRDGSDDFESYADGGYQGSGQLDEGTGWAESWTIGGPIGAGSYRYYRLRMLANNGDPGFCGVLEFELRETVGGTNRSIGATATSSDNFTGFGPEKAIDGLLTSTNGWASADANFANKWLMVDLGVARTITEYKVGSHASTTSTAARSLNRWRFEGSNDAATWSFLHLPEPQSGWTFGELRTFTP